MARVLVSERQERVEKELLDGLIGVRPVFLVFVEQGISRVTGDAVTGVKVVGSGIEEKCLSGERVFQRIDLALSFRSLLIVLGEVVWGHPGRGIAGTEAACE